MKLSFVWFFKLNNHILETVIGWKKSNIPPPSISQAIITSTCVLVPSSVSTLTPWTSAVMLLQAVLLECTHRDKPQDLCLIHMSKYILINFLIFLACPLMSAPSTSNNKTATTFSSVHLINCVPTLCDPMDCSTQAFLSITNSGSLLKLMSIESVMPSNHLILCRPLLLPPSIFPSIRVFSNECSSHQVAKVLEFKLQF